MKLCWIEFENLKTGLKIEKIEFFNDVTLLVGLSGVGKTQILNAIYYSLRLALDESLKLKPYKVNMGIKINDDIYKWSYEINSMKINNLILEENEEYQFIFERLECNDELIFDRNLNEVKLKGFEKVPNPKKGESLICQYLETPVLEVFVSEIKKRYSIEMELAIRGGIGSEKFNVIKATVDKMKKDGDVDFRMFSHLPVLLKLYIVKKYYFDKYVQLFEMIKELFIEIEDIDIVEDVEKEMYMLSINVFGRQLFQYDISNGMLKTIYYIVELFTMPEESLVLIDEFENGLGVNCIDLLSEIIMFERRDIQFVITSHHPKIINKIDKDKWKIIDRDVTKVTNHSSDEYGIGKSQHDAYFQLINRWEYEGRV